jgi:membrane-associated phospholipid phosphatase
METQPHEESSEPATAHASHLRLLLRVLTRRDGRAPVWLEALVVVWLLWLYDQINNLAPLRRIVALHNAANLLAFERSLNIAPELGLDRWVAAHATLGLILSYYYVSAHFFVTFGLLGYMWWRKPRTYRPLRTQLVLINLIGLAIFWLYPVAPPRMLANDGFRDIIVLTQAVGDFHQGGLASTADQYAAMPSLHIAWAIWSACVVWAITRKRVLRVVAVAYPLVTAFVVIGTGNHFLLDVFAGAMVVLAAILLEVFAARKIHWYARRRFGLAHLRRGPAQADLPQAPEGTAPVNG